jgi:uncharacterized cupredoxin-like copper-binding protein
MRAKVLGLVVASLLASGSAMGHGDSHAKKRVSKSQRLNAEETSFGRSGDPKSASQTITVGMDDSMHFTPGDVRVKQGETVKFVVKNNGKIMHEMVIGTMKELKEHAELMKKHPGMEHDEPYMAHVSPGKTEAIVWQFTKAGEFHYACLIPGHLEAGMIAKITVEPRK